GLRQAVLLQGPFGEEIRQRRAQPGIVARVRAPAHPVHPFTPGQITDPDPVAFETAVVRGALDTPLSYRGHEAGSIIMVKEDYDRRYRWLSSAAPVISRILAQVQAR